MTTRPILVGYDGSPSAQAALTWALDEGRRTGRPVLLAYVLEPLALSAPVVPVVAAWPDAAARRDAEAMVRDAVAAARTRPDVTVTGVVLDGPAGDALTSASHRAALLVVGNRGHGGFADLLVGSTSVAVAAQAHCPVVVVRGEEVDPARAIGPVVVGVDGSACSLLALEYAFERAAERDAPLRVITAWTPPPPRQFPYVHDPAAVTAAERDALDELLTDWRRKFPQVTLTAEVVAAAPGLALVRASRDAQLMVVGSRGRGGFRGLLFGSVSQQLLHHSRCPVAVVREPATPDAAPA